MCLLSYWHDLLWQRTAVINNINTGVLKKDCCCSFNHEFICFLGKAPHLKTKFSDVWPLPPAPCPPSGVEYSGNGSFATVAWNASVFASTYTVYDPSATPPAQLCSTAGLSCSLSNVASPSLLITASNTAGESETTSVPQGRNFCEYMSCIWKDPFHCIFKLKWSSVTPFPCSGDARTQEERSQWTKAWFVFIWTKLIVWC